MNLQLSFARDRNFRTGVGATIIVGFLLTMGMPSYLYRAKHIARMGTSLERATGLSGGGGGGDRAQLMGFVTRSESPGYDDER